MPPPSPAYTPHQLSTYLSHISLPPATHPPSLTLPYLSRLLVHQLSAVPYENLSLHYSPVKRIDLSPAALYKKFITDGRGRGGYCMEVGIFFNHVLRGLGFEAYMTGVRIRPREGGVPGGSYMGWVHIVNIVTLPPDPTSPSPTTPISYMLDVAFGGDGPTVPLPLLPQLPSPLSFTNIGSQQIRLLHGPIPCQTRSLSAQKYWIYQYRNGVDRDWNSFYCFTETEWLSADFEVLNFFTSTSEESFQTFTVLVVKFLRGGVEKRGEGEGEGEDGGEDGGKGDREVYGKVMLVNGEVKMNTGGKTQVVKVCKTEAERVEALREYFGIELTEEEREGIRGTCTDLG